MNASPHTAALQATDERFGGAAMNQTFPALRLAAGLSQQDAADFLGVRLDTIKQWSSGRRAPPPPIVEKLRELLAAQETEAVRLSAAMRAGDLSLENALASSDEDAQGRGWPSAAAYNVAVARAWAMAADKAH